jgi:Inverse autotransporter, beta-domain
MIKKIFITGFFCFISATSLLAADPQPNSIFSFESIPEWVSRVKVAMEGGSDIKPRYFLESVQPLSGSQDQDVVYFNHARISSSDYRTTYNMGVGARRVFKDKFLLGANIFYDFQDLHQHHRAGAGLEAFTDRGLEARLNTYFRISSPRLVNEVSGVQEYEKVANGLDWELGSPLPYLPFLKLYGGGNWYSFEKFRNKYGWKARLEYNPVKNSRLVFSVLDDNKRGSTDYRIEGAITLAFTSFNPRDIINDIKTSKQMFPKINLQEKTLERVVRDFDITVIKYNKNVNGLIIEGGKS